MSERAWWSATRWAGAIAQGKVTARDAVELYLERITRLNPKLNAIICLEADRARAAADKADAARLRGAPLGPLHGVPMTIKESFQWAGTPVTYGMVPFRDNRPQGTALVVERLEAAGAILMGKTNVPYALADFQSYNAIHGVTGNPFDLSRTPGGSSGGSAAALAAGLSALDYGSDIGGSIRNPAHYSGVFGHKPTWGLVPPTGHALDDSLAPTDISVVGPLARTAEDLELALSLTAGAEAGGAPIDVARLPRLQGPVEGLRIATWLDDPLCPTSAAVRDRLEAVAGALARAGARIDGAARPAFSAGESHRIYLGLLQSALAARQPDEAFAKLVDTAEHGDPARPSTALARLQTMRFHERARLDEARLKLRRAWIDFFGEVDFLLTPVMPTTAFPHDHRPEGQRTVEVDGKAIPYFSQLFWAGLVGVAGLPGTVVPVGPAADGLPVGVQIVGAPWHDFRTIGLARRLEAMGFGFTAPPLDWADTGAR